MINGKDLFKLRFSKKEIHEWAERYHTQYDEELEIVIAPQVKARGYFLRGEFIRLCRRMRYAKGKMISVNYEFGEQLDLKYTYIQITKDKMSENQMRVILLLDY